ncbi:virulence protein RhuM/Fic/DOC family protein [Candidatus Saccharibacteria bacterium]|nr:virulence protein RhuM/Fic/DOC family protein [Candidatus Saccharibacteria bacterium]
MTEEKRIEIYKGLSGEVVFDVDADGETIWATQEQMARLFDTTIQNINKHLLNIYAEGELIEDPTISILETVRGTSAKNAQVQDGVTRDSQVTEGKRTCKESLRVRNRTINKNLIVQKRTVKENLIVRQEGNRTVRRKVKMYNLDAIISVGYRVNSKKATQFRIWATSVLKRYLTDGVAVNEKRLMEISERREIEKLHNVEDMMGIVRRLTARSELDAGEANGVLEVISRYAGSFKTLQEYDDGHISLKFLNKARKGKELTFEMCERAVGQLRRSVGGSDLFGKPRGKMFQGSLTAIFQSFDGRELYPSVPEKAANLLYFVIKDHPFYDGNKRIGALLFILFLTLNDCHLTTGGETKISDRALTAIALLIAESEPKEKALIVSLVCKLLE